MQIQKFLLAIITLLPNLDLQKLSVIIDKLTHLIVAIGGAFLCVSIFLWVYKK